MPDIADILIFIQEQGVVLLFKILLLLLIFVYIVFTVIVATRVNTLNRTLSLSARRASALITFLSVAFVLASIFLFIIVLVMPLGVQNTNP